MLADGLDLTDRVKGHRQYRIRFGAGAKELVHSGLTLTTVCQANGAIIIERGPLLPGGEVAGPIMIGIGAAALVGGIFLGISGETKYSLSTGASAPAIGLSPTGVSLVF